MYGSDSELLVRNKALIIGYNPDFSKSPSNRLK